MREFGPGRLQFRFEVADRPHDETRHAERALETLLVDDALFAGCRVPSAAASPSIVTMFLPRGVCVSIEQESCGNHRRKPYRRRTPSDRTRAWCR